MQITDAKIYTNQYDGLGTLKFFTKRVPTGLPDSHPDRELYDDRALEGEIDPGTDTYWVRLTTKTGAFKALSVFGYQNSDLVCLNMDLPDEMQGKGIDTRIYDLVEITAGQPIA